MVKYSIALLGLVISSIWLVFPHVLAQTTDHTIFFDDFEDSDLAGWDTSFAEHAVEVINLDGNNVLHITGEQNDFVSLGFSGDFNGAPVIEARMQLVDLGPNNGSVVFNLMSENPGHASGYSALISIGGASFLNRNDNFRDIEPNTRHDFHIELNHWYHIRFESTSQALTLSVNDEIVQIAQVEVLETGEPVFIFDRGMEVYLDDIRVEQPDFVTAVPHEPDEIVVIGQVTVGSSVLFRSDPATDSPTVPRNSSLNTYEVIDIVEHGDEVQINGITSSEWYYIRIPEDTPRYAYVSAAVVTRFERYDESAPSSEILAETFEPSVTPNSEVAALPSSSIDLPNDRLVPVDVVRQRAPRTYQWSIETGGFVRDTRIITINPESLGTLVDVDGNPLQHGVYTPDNPPPVRPELLPSSWEINGQRAEYGYVVGTFSFGVSRVRNLVENREQISGRGAVTFFVEGTNAQINVFFPLDDIWTNASVGVQAPDGSEVGTPSDQFGLIPYGQDPSRHFVIDYDSRTVSIPTENGPVVIREGDEVMLAILWNQEISNYARTWGDQLPSEWMTTVFDDDHSNDPEQIYIEPMGIVVSDRSTTPETTTQVPEGVSVEVAMAPQIENANLVPASELRNFPSRISYYDSHNYESISVNINRENLAQMGVPLGVFRCEDYPLTQEALAGYREFQNDLPLEARCISGIVTRINSGQGIQMVVPLPETGGYFRINISNLGSGALFLAAENNTVIPAAPGTLSTIGRITYGTNPNTEITYDDARSTITIPTAQGLSTLRVGDQLVARVLLTEEVYHPGMREIFSNNSGGLSPSEVIETIYDGNRNNNPEKWTIPSSAFLMNFRPE